MKKISFMLLLFSFTVLNITAQNRSEFTKGDPLQRIKISLPPLNGLTAIDLRSRDIEKTDTVYQEAKIDSRGTTWQQVIRAAKDSGFRAYRQIYRLTNSHNSGHAEMQFSSLADILLLENKNEFIIVIISFDENDHYLLSTIYQADRSQKKPLFTNHQTSADIIARFTANTVSK